MKLQSIIGICYLLTCVGDAAAHEALCDCCPWKLVLIHSTADDKMTNVFLTKREGLGLLAQTQGGQSHDLPSSASDWQVLLVFVCLFVWLSLGVKFDWLGLD